VRRGKQPARPAQSHPAALINDLLGSGACIRVCVLYVWMWVGGGFSQQARCKGIPSVTTRLVKPSAFVSQLKSAFTASPPPFLIRLGSTFGGMHRSILGEHAFGAGYGACPAGVFLTRPSQGASKRLECCFHYVMGVPASQLPRRQVFRRKGGCGCGCGGGLDRVR
jgi:hypothetical protein